MNVEIVEAGPEHATALENLFQLYTYDFSEVIDCEVNDEGRFKARSFEPYWIEPWRFAFLIRVDEHLAGFALVHQRSHLNHDPNVYDMAEFLVLRRYRRLGIGADAAAQLFERFRGRWEVRELVRNQSATAFWRKAIDRYTGGRFSEVAWDDAQWRGPVQRFES